MSRFPENPLRWLSGLLADAGIRHWVDSGTLLGLVREGGLLAHDNDIDFGAGLEDAEKLDALLDTLDPRVWWVKRWYYRGRLFKAKIGDFEPWLGFLRKTKGMDMDVQLFGRGPKGEAWCPQIIKTWRGARDRWKNRIFWTLMCHTRWNIHMDRFPWKLAYAMHTWVVPAPFFDEMVQDGAHGVPVPKQAEEYLAYRYGDWRTPNKNWVTERDDRCLKAVPPSAFLG